MILFLEYYVLFKSSLKFILKNIVWTFQCILNTAQKDFWLSQKISEFFWVIILINVPLVFSHVQNSKKELAFDSRYAVGSLPCRLLSTFESESFVTINISHGQEHSQKWELINDSIYAIVYI